MFPFSLQAMGCRKRGLFLEREEVLGDLSYDKKGDITKLDYVMYIWKKDPSGKITYVQCPDSGCAM